MMPTELILVRHGESEGNVASNLLKKGDRTYGHIATSTPNAQWRLSPKGVEQAKVAGKWIQENIHRGVNFGRMVVSEYVRAMETAGHLGLPGQWYLDYNLRERCWGDLEHAERPDWKKLYTKSMKLREQEPWFWTPPNGESMATLSLRVDRVLNTLHRECSDQRVLVVCHGETMWAFRMRLERMTQVRYKELDASDHPHNRIHNCQVLHYTRQWKGTLYPKYAYMRSVCPTDETLSSNDWQHLDRPTFRGDELLTEVEKFPRRLITS